MWKARPDGVYAYNSADGIENATEIKNQLSALGWSINAICGVLGNIFAEGGGNPWQWEYSIYPRPPIKSDGLRTIYGYGLFGWTPAAKYLDGGKAYIGFSPNYADDPGTVLDGAAQVSFMDYAIEHSVTYYWRGNRESGAQWIEGARGTASSTTAFGKNWYRYYTRAGRHSMKASDFKVSNLSPGYLALTFLECFEGPFNPIESYITRQNIANYFYEYFKGQPPEPSPDPINPEFVKRNFKLLYKLRSNWRRYICR